VILLVATLLFAAVFFWALAVARRVRQSDSEVAAFATALRASTAQRESNLAAVRSAVADVDLSLERWNLTLDASVTELRSLTAQVAPRTRGSGKAERVEATRPQAPRSVSMIAGGRVAKGYALQNVKMTLDAMRGSHGHGVRPPSETLGLAWPLPVEFIVPTLGIPRPKHSSSRSAVAVEDMLAAKSVAQALLIRWPDADIHTSTVDPGAQWGGLKGNICTFCRDSRNPVTGLVLAHPQTQALFRVSFPDITSAVEGGPQELGIRLGDGPVWASPSYAQERAVGEGTSGPTVLEDLALLARVPNPWDPAGKVLVVAGIRAFGTLGVAEYVRRSWDDLNERTKGLDFACVLRVRATYQVVPADEGAVPLSEPAEVAANEVELVPAEDVPAEVEIVQIEPAA